MEVHFVKMRGTTMLEGSLTQRWYARGEFVRLELRRIDGLTKSHSAAGDGVEVKIG